MLLSVHILSTLIPLLSLPPSLCPQERNARLAVVSDNTLQGAVAGWLRAHLLCRIHGDVVAVYFLGLYPLSLLLQAGNSSWAIQGPHAWGTHFYPKQKNYNDSLS